MGRGLGKIQRFILEYLKEKSGWKSLLGIIYNFYHKQAGLGVYEDWQGVFSENVYQSFARAARTLENREIIESRKVTEGRYNVQGGATHWKSIRLVQGKDSMNYTLNENGTVSREAEK